VTIDDVTDEILDKVILCEKTGKPYRIIKQELDFYRKHHLPLPTKHQDTRKEELMKKRMPKEFHIINCANCNEEVLSVYLPTGQAGSKDSGYIIWCEACYNKKFY
jgi:DNA-directed RNA polymerase subunit M/transcription elongation factor TFIIS